MKWRKLTSHRRAIVALTSATAFSQLVALAAAPLLTRLYLPVHFGELSIYASALALAVGVSSLRYHLAIPIPRSEVGAIRITYVSLIVVWSFSALLGFIVLVLHLSGVGRTIPHLWILPLSVAAAGTYQTLNYWGIRKREFVAIARTKLKQGLGQTVVQIGLGLLQSGGLGLIAGHLVGQAAGSTDFVRSLRQAQTANTRITTKRLLAAAKRYSRFAIFGVPSSLLIVAALQLPPILVAGLFGLKVAGLFALSQRLMSAPLRLVGQAVGQTYLGEAAHIFNAGGDLQPLFRRSVIRLAVIGVLPIIVVGLAAPTTFGWVFGHEWREAGVFVLLLVPLTALQFVVSPISQTVHIVQKQHLELWGSASRLAAVLLVFGAAAWLGWSPRTTIASYSAVMAVTYVVFLLLYEKMLPRNIPVAARPSLEA